MNKKYLFPKKAHSIDTDLGAVWIDNQILVIDMKEDRIIFKTIDKDTALQSNDKYTCCFNNFIETSSYLFENYYTAKEAHRIVNINRLTD